MLSLGEWNQRIIAGFRANAGRVHWSNKDDLAAGRPIPPRLPGFSESEGPPIILVHTIGAKTGRKRIHPLMFRTVDDDFIVFATYGGSPTHPAWFRNLLAHPETMIEAGAETIRVTARVAEGNERERIWSQQVAAMPKFGEFEATAGRQIPVVVMERRY